MSFLGFGGGGNTVSVRILGDASQLNRELKGAQGQAEEFERKTGRSVGRLSTGIKAGLAAGAGAAIVGFAKSSVNAFSDLNESVNAVQVTFGDAADGILKLGENAAKTRGISNAAFNSMAVQFSAFTETIAGQSGRGVVDVMDELTQRGTDFASVMNLDVNDAMQKFQSGLAGETEPLRRFGIDMSAARVKAKALELGIGSTSGELTEQEKILVRYQLLMEQTDKTAGDFANTSDDLANKQRIVAAKFEDAKAAVGEGLVPVMQELLDIAEPLILAMEGLGKAVGFLSAQTEKMEGSKNPVISFLGALIDRTKKTLDPISTLSQAWKDFTDLTERTPATQKEIEEAFGNTRDQLHNFGGEVELTTEQLKQNEATLKAQAAAQENAAAKADAHREALRRQQEALQEIHNPIFRAVSLLDDLEAAEDAVTEASKKGITSDEYRDAIIDRAKILADLKNTLLDLMDEGIDPTGAAARQMLKELGIPDDVIAEIFADIDSIKNRVEAVNPRMTIDMFIPQKTIPTGGGGSATIGPFHEGGVVPGLPGQNQLALVAGGETILPTHDPSKMNGMGGGNVTIVNIGTQLGAERKLREIQEEARRQ